MKKIAFLISLFVLTAVIYSQQFPSTYPFETYLDSDGNLYVTGEDNGSILIQKIVGQNIQNITYQYSNGKGMDVVGIPATGKIYVAGYIYNDTTGDNDIIVLKYSTNGGGTLVWHTEYDNASEDDRGFGIAIDASENIYICGYVTNNDMTTDYMVIKYNEDGELQWDNRYALSGNEVATDLLLDNNFVYVMGYKDEPQTGIGGPTNYKDAMLLTYTLSGSSPCTTVVDIPSTVDIPTSFVFTEMGDNNIPPIKSKASIGGFTESVSARLPTCDYLTVHFTVNSTGDINVVDWYETWGTSGFDDIGTGVTTDNSGNIVVTGYYYNSGNHDFATLKYDKDNGTLIWGPVLYDYQDGIDRASSVNRNGSIYAVSGYSQLSPTNNFVTQSFSEDGGTVEDRWTSTYEPDFLSSNSSPSYTNFGTESYVLADSSVITVAYAWNNQNSIYAVVKYDAEGDVVYTVEDTGGDRPNIPSTQNEVNTSFELKQNFPNPFNPVTVISYSLPVQSHVTLKVYDLLGREIAELVNTNQQAGSYNTRFDGSRLASGIYIYKITAISGSTRFEKIEKMTLIK
jgi:hypothetical protein